MRNFAPLVLAAALAATPLAALADGLAFKSVDPQGLDGKAQAMVAALQASMDSQMPAFEQNGYGYYGALAVPQGMELKPELLFSVANFDTTDAAEKAVIEACKAQTKASCTVIGLLVPKES
jgi:hypothetical protein